MSTYTIENAEVKPYFDVELIMRTAQETRVGGHAMERMTQLWTAWSSELQARLIDTGKVKYLAVWLPETVEDAIDKAWADSPSQAYMDNSVAQTLCMEAVHSVLPQVEEAGCAPAPRPTDTLRAALQEIGLPYKDDGPVLSRLYGVVTHYPFKGACEICSLQRDCPKGQGQSGAASVVLPGYEREQL